jgi:Na+:H+ antiporter, NhaA family
MPSALPDPARENGSVSILRSERLAALLLVGAAVVGLVLANTPAGPGVTAFRDTHVGLTWFGLDLSVGHWITDGLLAVFFLLAAIELRHELTHGELDTPRKALVPAIAALGGVAVPALIYLLIVHDPALRDGWPIPTATDIAFALGVLSLAGRGLPSRIRALLLALAVLDDLVAILLIAFFFTRELQPVPLLLAVPVVIAFGLLSTRVRGRLAPLVVVVLIVLGIAAWVLVHASGVHATIAGVALGLALSPRVAGRARTAIEPWSNAIVLPLFALTASLVAIPAVGIGALSPAFWGIAVGLPAGKLVGITAGARLAGLIVARSARIPLGDIVVLASLGGIGFTVSLLMNELAFAGDRTVAAEGTLAVLCGSAAAIVIGTVVTVVRSRYALRATRPAGS